MRKQISTLLLTALIAGSSYAEGEESGVSAKDVYVSLRLPSIDIGLNLAIGTPIGKKSFVGVGQYVGGMPMAGGGTNSALFLRSFLFNNSFYVEGRAGYMRTSWGHPSDRADAGRSYGLQVGNHWFYKSGFHQGVVWFGYDGYLKATKVPGLPHFPSYELGFSF